MAIANSKPTLRLMDYSDRELLALVRDHQDQEGWADSLLMAQQIWPKYASDNPVNARASVAIRFAWLKRWGVMEHDNKRPAKWRLTKEGQEVVAGTLSKAQERAVVGLTDEKLMNLGYALSDRYQLANDIPATLLRRAWQFAQMQRRSRV